MPNAEHGGRWYRTAWIQPTACAVMCTAWLVGACIAAPAGNTAIAVVAIGMTVVWGYFLIGYLRGGIAVSPPGVAVRTVHGRTINVPWPEVAGFQIVRRRSARGDISYLLTVMRTNGRPLATEACSWQKWTNKSWPAQIAKMNQLVATLEDIRGQYASAKTSGPG